MFGVDIRGRAEFVKVASHRHHAQVLSREFDLRVVRIELPVAHEGPPLLPPQTGHDTIVPSAAIVAQAPPISGGHLRMTWALLYRVPCRLGHVLPPRRHGPPDVSARKLLSLPPRVLFHPVVGPALRPAITQTRSATSFIRDVMLEIASGR